MIKKTIKNTSTNKGNKTFIVTGDTWNCLERIAIPVEYTVTECQDEIDALGTVMNMLCGYLYNHKIFSK